MSTSEGCRWAQFPYLKRRSFAGRIATCLGGVDDNHLLSYEGERKKFRLRGVQYKRESNNDSAIDGGKKDKHGFLGRMKG